MRKIFIISLATFAFFMFVGGAFAARPGHPPTPEPSENVAPSQAAGGLHRACGNTDGIANHVLLYRVGPGPH